jgi:hypothetical protein
MPATCTQCVCQQWAGQRKHQPCITIPLQAAAWRASFPAQQCRRAADLRVIQLRTDAAQVQAAAAPERNLQQRACVLAQVGAVLPVEHVADLARPVHDGRLQPLRELLVARRL